MPQATIVAAYTASGFVHMAVAVVEPGQGRTEYIGRIPLDAAWQTAPNAVKREMLVAAVKAAREAQFTTATPIPITGSVDV